MKTTNPYVRLYIKDDILIGQYKERLHITLEIAKEIVQSRLAFTNGEKYATMIIARGITGMDKPARDYLSSAEATAGLIATALVINSSFQRIMGNFFISVNRTTMPVRIFTSEAGAEKWLRKFI